ncbi:MAG TPA: glycoside hydrolase family 2 TIM barrel-domain containing protein [Abditibacterium sp.]|jgi:beta-galactosidase/beta-glucuronidase
MNTPHSECPRPEYPRPQFVREHWLNLNGPWQFEIDCGDSGKDRGLHEVGHDLAREIIVPFCPESKLSGIENTDFMPAVWYKKRVQIPAEWKGQKVLLHFGAVDYDATVWVNGFEVGRHRGGFTPFSCPLFELATGGDEIEICVRARDDNKSPKPRGKQSQLYGNHGCFYTRTTGIWQTVWMEPVGEAHLLRPRITPEVGPGRFRLEQRVQSNAPGLMVRATLRDEGGVISSVVAGSGYDLTPRLDLEIPRERRRLWTTTDPFLYDIDIELLDEAGNLLDRAQTYCGLRGIAIDGKAIRINGEVIFQRLVLDQGYYPDGIMTAPTDQDLINDIELSFKAGFNGARLHQKVFEERFLYHADRMGYLCWGEFGDWGCRYQEVDRHQQYHGITFAAQWAEALERDYSHPSIIGWCPLNETYQEIRDEITELDDAARAMYLMTKLLDTTRPVLDASGYSHRVPETDIYDSHDYAQDPNLLRENQQGLVEGKPYINGDKDRPWNIIYRNQPYFVSEFGGIHWKPGAKILKNVWAEGGWGIPGEDGEAITVSWGYGASPETLDEFYARFDGLCGVLLDNPAMFGYCYTQLTDVYQEENGIYNFDRTPKFDMERIAKAQLRRAAIEVKYGAK